MATSQHSELPKKFSGARFIPTSPFSWRMAPSEAPPRRRRWRSRSTARCSSTALVMNEKMRHPPTPSELSCSPSALSWRAHDPAEAVRREPVDGLGGPGAGELAVGVLCRLPQRLSFHGDGQDRLAHGHVLRCGDGEGWLVAQSGVDHRLREPRRVDAGELALGQALPPLPPAAITTPAWPVTPGRSRELAIGDQRNSRCWPGWENFEPSSVRGQVLSR